jgi:hypothetical protein
MLKIDVGTLDALPLIEVLERRQTASRLDR